MEFDFENQMFVMALWIGILYTYFIICSSFLPPDLAKYALFGGLGIILFGLWFQELASYKAVAKYKHLYAIIRGKNENYRTHLYIDATDTRLLDYDNRIYRTEMKAGIPFKIRGIGKVKTIYVYHKLPLGQRLRFGPGLAYYKGTVVEHSQSDSIVLWEMPDVIIKSNFEVVPQFWLVEGGNDRSRFMSEYLIMERDVKYVPEVEEPLRGVFRRGDVGGRR
ncbi:MAG: hypothetical protein QXP04_00330 [Candidatus Nanoarchaeia archaeon]|nr:hypothetical protein [Candidatus Jingweiarchaeum tengchongense]